MSRRPTMYVKMLKIALMVAVGVFSTLMTMTTLAQNAPKVTGELSKNGSVTINGAAAISGATIFSESHLKTERNSEATINLGKLGRIQLGPESEMTLRFADGSIGGELTSGHAVVNAPAGVAVSVTTADGVATADGKQASALTVDVSCGNTRVAAGRNQAKVTSGSKVEFVAAGSEVAVGQQPTNPRCARLAASKPSRLGTGAIAALVIAGVGGALIGTVAASESDDVTPSSVVVSSPRP
ncbi:MAG TPA: hypothetical protein VJ302_20090 [Blastocatellia bacterium]|nr:hypothetical protein [Blastocatellia bacterium]